MTRPVRARTYSADTVEEAAKKFEADAAEAAKAGYFPTSQAWEGSSLTVVYQKAAEPPRPQAPGHWEPPPPPPPTPSAPRVPEPWERDPTGIFYTPPGNEWANACGLLVVLVIAYVIVVGLVGASFGALPAVIVAVVGFVAFWMWDR